MIQSRSDMLTAALTDAEIEAICAGLRQGAAMVRYLQRLGVPVQRNVAIKRLP